MVSLEENSCCVASFPVWGLKDKYASLPSMEELCPSLIISWTFWPRRYSMDDPTSAPESEAKSDRILRRWNRQPPDPQPVRPRFNRFSEYLNANGQSSVCMTVIVICWPMCAKTYIRHSARNSHDYEAPEPTRRRYLGLGVRCTPFGVRPTVLSIA